MTGLSDEDTDTDIVRVILERVSPLVPDAVRAALDDLDGDLRREYGGLRVRIPKRRGDLRSQRRVQAYQAALAGEPEDAIQDKFGISRRTLYRLVKRGPAYRPAK